MSNILAFNNFKTSAKRLKEFVSRECLLEYYHHNTPSEPSVSVLSIVEDVFYGNDGFDKYLSIRFKDGTDITFTDEAYNTNLSNDDVVFSSKFDDETYCILFLTNRESR